MSEKQISIILAVIVAVVGIALFVKLSGISVSLIGGDFEISLPHHYSIVRCSSENVALYNTDGEGVSTMVMGPNIDGYRVYEDALVGHITKPRPEDEDKNTAPGYFIFAFNTAEVKTGLTREKWIVELRKHGIRSAPSLHRPTGFDPLYGYNRPGR